MTDKSNGHRVATNHACQPMKPARRRFLAATAAISAAVATSRHLYSRLNPVPPLNVNRVGLRLGHLLRDGVLTSAVPQSTHDCTILILGSGAAALSALWQLSRAGVHGVLLAEGIERDGNNAAYHNGDLHAPSGAHYLALPSAESHELRVMLADLGILEDASDPARLRYRETDLVHAPSERLYYQNRWQDELLPQEDEDSRRFHALIRRLQQARGSDGCKTFAIPIIRSSTDSDWRALDQLTFADWLARENYRSPPLLWYLDYCCRDDYGQGIDTVSAYAGLHYFAARGHDGNAVLTWPDGLAHLSRLLREKSGLRSLGTLPPLLGDARPAAYDASATRIQEHGDHVEVHLRDNTDGSIRRLIARHVISAMPLHIAARLIAEPARYGLDGSGLYAPWLISNFALHQFPREPAGQPLAWDNVLYGSPALGYIAGHNQIIRVAKPPRVLFTAYRALAHDSPAAVRQWLLTAPDDELLACAAADLRTVYGRHFWRLVDSVDITVRAHAMRIPLPGYLDDAQLRALRAHRSRLHFAHSDLSGYSVFEEAAYWGITAARQVLDARQE